MEVEKKMGEIRRNNYEQQKLLSKDKRFKSLNYISEFESKTGLFNVNLYKNSEAYLLTYLNALIHGLLKAMNESQLGVNLITFNLGDLLRSRCYSKETEIIALYQ